MLVLRDVLGDSVVGVYLFGSAVVGGLRPASDVDILAVSKESLSEKARQRLATELMRISGSNPEPASARPIELTVVKHSEVVPWHYPPQSEFVYGEWLRQVLEVRPGIRPEPDPDLAIVLTKAREASVPMFGPRAQDLLDPIPAADVRRAIADTLPGLISGLEGDERNVLLTLARMWMTLATGDIKPKDVAATWALDGLPPEQSAVLKLARAAYRGEAADDWNGRGAELNAVVHYLREVIEELLGAGATAPENGPSGRPPLTPAATA